MSKSKSDKPLVRNMIIFCVIAILIFHFAWAKYLFMNYSQFGFAIIDFIVAAAFIVSCSYAYKNADDPNKEWLRYLVVILAVISSAWAASWSTALMNNLDQGI